MAHIIALPIWKENVMADAKVKTVKKPQGPRVVKPLYLIVKGNDAPEILSVTKDPLKIVEFMSSGEAVKFVDLNQYLPKKSKAAATA